MPKRKKTDIADEAEIMRIYTAILRRELTESTIKSSKDGTEIIQTPPSLTTVMHAGEAIIKRIDHNSEINTDDTQTGVILMPYAELKQQAGKRENN